MRTLFYSSLRWAGLLAIVGGALSGCLNPPDYSDTPSIDNARVSFQQRLTGNLGTRDSLVLTVSYQDGTGDLGLSTTDNTGVYDYMNGTNRNYFNYFLQPYVKDAQGNFQPRFTSAPGEYNGRFPRITADGTKEAPVKGDLRYSQSFGLGSPFRPGDVVHFVISIQDRALHESNQVTTNDITIP
ncbi:hypothetical protein ACFQ48_02910 [Hymenobacter caeli]|uniref:DUF3823 domain-containing protein n=1 Tax=Hymenobacter caeli TaxID=2735894 RepID=A0ABX2FKZ0_9BACT|nr:hypothetical protein [Hymenobacter caeli]NRT17774.1 hypothetical protein [Hymenobacter caeli]